MNANRLHAIAGTFLAAVVLGGCATPQGEHIKPGPDGAAYAVIVEDARVEESRTCLSSADYDTVEVLNNEKLMFFGRDEVWVNDLRHRCSGLESYDTIAFRKGRSASICEYDEVRGLHRSLFDYDTGITCTLGEFDRIDEVHSRRVKEYGL